MKLNDLIIHNDIFKIISKCSIEINQKCYLIGGYVRDSIIGYKNPKDIDIVTEGDGILLAEKVLEKINSKNKLVLFKRFKTAMLKYQNYNIEFVSARKESYYNYSRNPIIQKGTLEDDQNRRDFTINTLAVSLNTFNYGYLLDPFNGLNDIKNKIIKTPLNPEITYSDDPLRMFRAIRFATQLNFCIDKNSINSIKNNINRVKIISIERIMEEFKKILLSKKPSIGINLLYNTGLLKIILPELTLLKGVEEKDGFTHKDNFYHTLEVLDNISIKSDILNLRWVALLHDIGKVPTKKYIPNIGWTFYSHEFIGSKMIPNIFRRLKLPLGNSMKYIQKIIKYSSRPIALIEKNATDSAVRRLIFEMGDDLEDLITLCKSDITTKNLIKNKKYNENFSLVLNKINNLKDKDKIRNWKSPLSGFDIMNIFNIKSCVKIGVIKNSLKEAILEGKILNEKISALKFVLKKGKELGLKK